MILLEIHAPCVSFLELERDAPRPVDVDAVADRLAPLEGMEVEARHVHFLGRRRRIQAIKAKEDALICNSADSVERFGLRNNALLLSGLRGGYARRIAQRTRSVGYPSGICETSCES